MKRQVLGKVILAGMVLALVPAAAFGISHYRCANVRAAEAVTWKESTGLGVLSWPQNLNAVRWELEVFAGVPAGLDDETPVSNAVYRNEQIYMNSVMLDTTALPQGEPLFFRVRPYDLDGNPVGHWSQPAELTSSLTKAGRNAPMPHNPFNKGNGTVLLYPVYAYTPNPGAEKFEVEVLDHYPEKLDGWAPSKYRVYADVTELTDLYDKRPRTGTYYWRVRGMDRAGNPVGEWSLPQEMHTSTSDHWKVAVFGDSISHGGGHLSFSPADFSYSYESYLDFPSINLSESGDTSEMMVDRFRKDVVPFHPDYLLVMGGTNSLRAGVSPDSVISDLKESQKEARDHGMTPILMTLPPINPGSIEKAFREPTYEGWRDSFAKVNDFIRTQPHIDAAAPFAQMDEIPEWMALDGLHGDWNMKQIMASVINREMPRFTGSGEYSF